MPSRTPAKHKNNMANKPIKVSIATGKIDKTLLVQKGGKTYLNIVLWPNREGEDEWGNTHMAKMDLTKEQIEAGAKSPIIGNAKVPRDDAPPQAPRKPAAKDASLEPQEESIPF